MSWTPERPHQGLGDLPPAGFTESSRVLKALISARSAVAELDGAARAMPNPDLLTMTFVLLESKASSEIESIVTTSDRLFAAAALTSEPTDPAVKETLSYRSALYEGWSGAGDRPLSMATAQRVCSRILGHEVGLRTGSDTVVMNPTTAEVIYTPPVGEAHLAQLLSQWSAFVNGRSELDPLTVMSLSHYQFEAIHPFTDGNGRTGRILNLLQLKQAGLLSRPVLYLSGAIIERKGDYYRLLQGVTEAGAWEEWAFFMVECCQRAAESSLAKVAAVSALRAEYQDSLAGRTPAGRVATMLDLLVAMPYLRIAGVMRQCDVSRPTATGWLDSLVELGVLSHRRMGRDSIYLNARLLETLLPGASSD